MTPTTAAKKSAVCIRLHSRTSQSATILTDIFAAALTKGIGETGQTPAEAFEVRERKQSIVNFSSDPFQLLSGQGHRQSISGGAVAGAAAAATRRRSSAAPTDAGHGSRSGYSGDTKLAPIESRPELPPVEGVGRMDEGSSSIPVPVHEATTVGNGAAPDTTPQTAPAPQIYQYDDPVSVAPDERR